MSKQIVYLIVHHGVDGRAPRSVLFASFDKEECEKRHNEDKNQCYNSLSKDIVDTEDFVAKAIEKLTQLESTVYFNSEGRTGDHIYYSVTENGTFIHDTFSEENIEPYYEKSKNNMTFVVREGIVDIEKVYKEAKHKLGVIALMIMNNDSEIGLTTNSKSKNMTQKDLSVKAPGNVDIKSIELVSDGFLKKQAVTFSHVKFDGTKSKKVTHERIVRGDAVHVLIFDPQHEIACLTKQIRPCVVDTDSPYMIELVAGMIDKGESPIEAAIREAREEVGVELSPELMDVVAADVFLAPGSLTERTSIIIASADLRNVQSNGGLADENEDIKPIVCNVDELKMMVQDGIIRDLPSLTAINVLMACRQINTLKADLNKNI